MFNDEIVNNNIHMCRIHYNMGNLIDFLVDGYFGSFGHGHVYIVKDMNSGLYKLGHSVEKGDIYKTLYQSLMFPYEIVFLAKTHSCSTVLKFFRCLFLDKAMKNPYNFVDKKFVKRSANYFNLSDIDLELLDCNSFPEFIKFICEDVKEESFKKVA